MRSGYYTKKALILKNYKNELTQAHDCLKSFRHETFFKKKKSSGNETSYPESRGCGKPADEGGLKSALQR